MIRVRHISEVLEFDVELSAIPLDDNRGKDVTVNWHMYDGFTSNDTFWSDSNGMQMMERRLNWKPTYTLKLDGHNVSNNFYPVTSAIAIRDGDKQVTVMNDRTQAGGADVDQKATIELMHHRRMVMDDVRGVEEALNERDETGYGIRVNARYYL